MRQSIWRDRGQHEYERQRVDNPGRTAGEAGWRISRYNLYAEIPGTAMIAVANLFKGMCSEFTPLEMDLLDEAGIGPRDGLPSQCRLSSENAGLG